MLIYILIYVNISDSTLRIKSSVLFGTHTLLGRSLRVLQLPTYLSKLTTNG